MAARRRADDPELAILKDRSLEIGTFLESEGVANELIALLRDGITAAHERRDLRGLQMASRDLLEWVRTLRPDAQQRLDDRLRTRFGVGLTNEVDDVSRSVAKILRRGKISNDDEYRLLRSVTDNLPSHEAPMPDISTIERLLLRYTRRSR